MLLPVLQPALIRKEIFEKYEMFADNNQWHHSILLISGIHDFYFSAFLNPYNIDSSYPFCFHYSNTPLLQYSGKDTQGI